jgi:DNA-binding response OmpR family regulator
MDNPRQTVLLVEDDPDLRKLVKMYLERMGLLVVEAADGRSALRRLTEVVPDLACLDLVLPEYSGYEVCEFTRRSPAMHDIPILVMSGRALPGDRAHAVEMGASAYLIKPFTRAEFTNQVDLLLRGSAARRISSQIGVRPPSPRPRVPAAPAQVDPFSYRKIRNYLGYAAGAVRRRKLLASVAFALVALGTVGLLLVLPKDYYVETRIWAQRNQATQALANPRSVTRADADAPTRTASETILRRDNLVALIKQTNLLANWKISSFPIPWLKERLISLVRGRTTEEDKINAVAGMLEKQMWVNTGESTVTIGIIWPDPTLAYQLVEAARETFLEARHASDISNLAETVSILDRYANNARQSIDASLEEIQSARDAKAAGRPLPVARQPNSEQVSPELAQIKVMLTANQRDIKDVQEFRQGQLAELQAQLVEKQSAYPSLHPVLVNLQQSIDAFAKGSPRLASLKKEEQALLADYLKRGGNMEEAATETPRKPPLDVVKVRREVSTPSDDPSLDYAKARLSSALNRYERLIERIESANIELDAARTAFKQRYTVTLPPQMPKKALTPTFPLVAGFIAALLMATAAAVAAALKAGRFVERWQVEQQLALPVLAQVRKP